MELADIEAGGGFVDRRLVPIKDKWRRFDDNAGKMVENEVGFFVRQVSYSDTKRVMQGLALDDTPTPETGEGAPALDPEVLMIAACIRLGEDGSQALSYEQVDRLEPALFAVFRKAVNSVYGEASADPKA